MNVLNKIETVAPFPKLSEVLFERRESTFNSLAALPSNIDAIDAAVMFSAGLHPFVALVGPSGWGKTHLLKAVANRICMDVYVMPEPISVSEYLSNPPKGESSGHLLLDDVQEAMGRSRLKMNLRMNLERRVRCGKPTLLAFTGPRPSRAIRTFLPMSREWKIVTLPAAEPVERVLLLHQMAAGEDLSLSPRLSKLIAEQMHGNGRTMSGALKRLRLSGTNWLDSSSSLRALGLLDPFFSDNGSWDLKLKILRVAESAAPQFSKVCVADLTLYTLLHEAGLSEVDVARVMGIEPSEAYLRATRFRAEIQTSESSRAAMRQFIELVLESLTKD